MTGKYAKNRPSPEDEQKAQLLRKQRRLERVNWPIRRFDLGSEPSDDLSDVTSAAERLAMVWPLTLQSWRLSGRDLPDYLRSEAPGRVVRAGEDP